ncbi:unnamed protein product [Urochloa humidicola]
MKALVACVAVALSLIQAVMAADYVVGDPAGGWDGKTNYKSWASAQTFAPGDTLTFKYNTYHNVLEVTKEAFEACTTSNPISFDNSGTTTVLLTMPGTRYFICGAPGHCLGGMKMEIEVADRPAPTTPSSPPPPPPPPPPPAHDATRLPAPAPMAPSPASTPSWAPEPAAPPRHAGHKKHKKKRSYCPPETLDAPARPPAVQAVENLFPFAEVTPMSSPPPPPATSSGGPAAVLRATWVQATTALAALGGFMLVAL